MSDTKFSTDKSVSTYVIRLVSSVVNGTAPPENTQNLDWDKIIEFAKRQCVLNIIAYACEKLAQKPEPATMKYLKEFRMQKIVVEAQQELEFCDAMDVLEKMGVRHMPLKGYIVKNLYPSPDMRTMGDLDLLIDESRSDAVVRAFVADGFTYCDEGDLHTNVERGNAYIEFHRAMVDKQHEKLYSYFGTGFERAKLCDGFNHRYELTHEDMYIFLVAHIAKHYRYEGTGIRSILDLYVYRRAYPDLDMNYIYNETKKMGLGEFYKKIEKLSDDWFSGSFNGEYDGMSSYIVAGGVYGLEEMNYINEFINETDESMTSRKGKDFLRAMFPDKETMCIRYPALKKCIYLLPLFWVIRFFDTLIRFPRHFIDRIKSSVRILRIDNDLVDAQRDSGIDKL